MKKVKAEEAEKKINKSVKLILKNGFHYSGSIKDVVGEDLVITDKYGAEVYISLEDISVFEEVGK